MLAHDIQEAVPPVPEDGDDEFPGIQLSGGEHRLNPAQILLSDWQAAAQQLEKLEDRLLTCLDFKLVIKGVQQVSSLKQVSRNRSAGILGRLFDENPLLVESGEEIAVGVPKCREVPDFGLNLPARQGFP
ncbi:MAG: hypothetical protein HYR52_06365 [Candidatus Tectomicrobia bacterium]|nr:hypothetical protein [Candidatus Tectomicrobia bacterium]